ncbi:hypothetical protein NIZ92_05125 [Alcaligenes sp. 1735tsa3]|uniref:hypothetical protein n=1 Tax=Alcaligenes sp. 1735tsa3 TaxID=2953809 RepID=UPI0020A788C9|nr:hypothetical protein [Alcaligenes sp. 1735tsa3]USY26434.1 hypothetical protein NIZ92_05125 [Alcaligenes sp. 1735tsa3]
MPTLKLGDVATTFVFGKDTYVDKLLGRNTVIDETNPSAIRLQINFAHYANRTRNSLEDSDFARLKNEIQQVSKLSIRDQTVAKKIAAFPNVAVVEIDIGDETPSSFSVTKQTADHREVAFEFDPIPEADA